MIGAAAYFIGRLLDMKGFIDILNETADFAELKDSLKKGLFPVNLTGVSGSLRACLIFCLCKELKKPAFVVSHSETAAKELRDDLKYFFGGYDDEDNALYFPPNDLMFYDIEAKANDVSRRRLTVLDRLVSDKDSCSVVTTLGAALGVTPPHDKYVENMLELSVGDDIELEEIIKRLTAMGYRREELVEGAGQFSVRGGILDFFPYYSDYPIRLEFFDTEIDSVRTFDPASQRTLDRLDSAKITPAGELILDDETRDKLIARLSEIEEQKEDEEGVSGKICANLRRDIERLRNNIAFPSIDKYIPYIYNEKPTLIDYISENYIVFWDDGARISEAYKAESERFAQDLTDMAGRGIIPDASGEYYYPLRKALARLTKRPFIGLSALSSSGGEYKALKTIDFMTKSLGGFQGRMEYFYETLDFYRSGNYRIIILGGSDVRAENLKKRIIEQGMSCNYCAELDEEPEPGVISITHGSLHHGFELPLIRTVVISDREIFGGDKKKRRKYRPKNAEKIDSFTDLKAGDYVVHQNYGIGQYIGIESLSVENVRKDYLKIRFRGEDFLYVPTDQMDLVYKHVGKEGSAVRLNKLGSGEWSRTKQRVKAAAADMAKELIELYAKRANSPGIAFDKDSEWQRDFEAAFPYEETDDQLRSIDEVKEDMEKPHPMDRLLCGDVGYGKTEVALRAAFKAVTSGYQVAYLAPTTILAAQHYNTFKQRMKDYPVNIAMLSRFCTGSEEKRVIKELGTGETDIVIGTHKLLGKNVKFNKLGLLIIDEEQRFGVAHKEKLKEMRKDIDVLTLSATPIPRTLYMSLSGIRDMSVISQPPNERYPVATYVLEYDEDVVREAINKELGRGGQVYYLYNRVDGIFKIAARIAELVPEARVAAAHGKMHESELEQIMMDLQEGRIDVLVCTTIIETGLDIPNVNTIIMENSDKLGLAQLYQLRGRVGRSNRLAYAYLTYRRNKTLTEDAEKRLLAIKEFTEFGSGFKIAMRDLEIRGTGNLIGAQQHGHMESVGYEMYCKLLEEAAKELKGEEVEKDVQTQIDLPVNAFISDSYISNHSQRLSAYKRIAAIRSQEELFDAYDEIEDRYGTVPQPVENLMEIALIKEYAKNCGIIELIGGSEEVTAKFDPDENDTLVKPEVWLDLMQKSKGKIYMRNPKLMKINFRIKKDKKDFSGREYLKELKSIMESAVNY